MLVQFVVFRVEPCEVSDVLGMALDRLQAKIQNYLSVLMQNQWEQNVSLERMIDDRVIKRCCQARLEFGFVCGRALEGPVAPSPVVGGHGKEYEVEHKNQKSY